MIHTRLTILICFAMLFFHVKSAAQDNSINWLSFEQLEDSLAVKPKKIFIDFYADWCVYCKKMENSAYKDPKVVSRLNTDYYAVKMNAETTDTIVFGGESFCNKQFGKKRNPTHEIPLLLASRENYPFSLPAIIVLNEEFIITDRYFEYMSPKKLDEALTE